MVWGKPAAGAGAWANAVEEEEQEHGAIQAPAAMPEQDFPSLGAASVIKETKKDKKKKQTMSLGDFMSSGSGRQFADPVLDLPTAPRGRAEGEERETGSTLGGGFRGYGGDRYGGGGGRGGRFDDEERRPRRQRDEEDMGPSRADVADNWGAERKFVPSDDRGYGGREGGFRDRGFGGGFRDRDERPRRDLDEGPSRADTGDWGVKQFVPSDAPPKRYDEPRGGGFRDREFREPSRADAEDRWERRSDVKPTGFDDRPRRTFDDAPRERRGFSESWRGREREVLSGPSSRDGSRDNWRREAPAGDDAEGAPKERPKLVLKPRTASADARAASEASRPSIFGAARPREDVLKEQGRDPIREEERLEATAKATLKPSGKKEREEEVALKAKIAEAQKKAEEAAEGEEKEKADEEVAALEADLAKLKLELQEKAASNRGRGGSGSRGENGRSSRGGGERSGSQRRDSGGGNRRRNDDRETSRNRASGERW